MAELIAVVKIIATFVKIAGGIWLAWGIIQLGLHINERDGGAIRGGLLQCVGAGVVLAGGIYLGTLS
jgi:hypothetical protein